MTDPYLKREQTLVKHTILREYLLRLAIVVGSKWDTITYVDCFAGPWKVQSADLSDTSFAVALKVLHEAQDKLARRGRKLKLRCLFVEKEKSAFKQLKSFADQAQQASPESQIEAQNSEFAKAVPQIKQYIERAGTSSFAFIFIDPTGWKGFPMNAMVPLLRINSSEVLINLMTSHIIRFIDHPTKQSSFVELHGSAAFQNKLRSLEGLDREDEFVRGYCRELKTAGAFQNCCTAIVLNPGKAKTHFHLIYGTRSLKGVEEFKDAERKTMSVMEAKRAEVEKRKEAEKGKPILPFSEPIHESEHYDMLRDRYSGQAKGQFNEVLAAKKRVPYDEIWEAVLMYPLVWEGDLKEWISELRKEGRLAVEGLASGQRVPQRGQKHILVYG